MCPIQPVGSSWFMVAKITSSLTSIFSELAEILLKVAPNKNSICSVDVISCISAHGTIHFCDYQLTILFLSTAMHPYLLLCCQDLWGLMKLIVIYNIYSIVYIPLYCCRGKDLHRKSSVSYSNL